MNASRQTSHAGELTTLKISADVPVSFVLAGLQPAAAPTTYSADDNVPVSHVLEHREKHVGKDTPHRQGPTVLQHAPGGDVGAVEVDLDNRSADGGAEGEGSCTMTVATAATPTGSCKGTIYDTNDL
eukprot:5656172-Pleurochrysis_carterae.AAC.1